jgi:DNA-binding transcriptional regulator YdaS (Cro superfamily)
MTNETAPAPDFAPAEPPFESTPLGRAIEAAGGVAGLASRIGVAASLPSMWKARGKIPAEHCPAIEKETGVRCEDLRPDVPWGILRGQTGVEAEASGT